jgi:AraC-like DNA-binding protein
MTFEISIYSIIDLFVILQGIIFGFIFLFHKKGQKQNIFLGFYLISYGIELSLMVLEDMNLIQDSFVNDLIPLNFYLLSTPLLYLYTKSLSRTFVPRKDLIHLIPGMVEILVGSIVLYLAYTAIITEDSLFTFLYFILYFAFTAIFIIYYSFRIFFFIHNHRKRVGEYYSNPEGKELRWIFKVAILNIVLGISSVLVYFIPFNNGDWSNEAISSTLTLIYILWISIGGLRQRNISEVYNNENQEIEEENSETTEWIEEFTKIDSLIKNEKLFHESNLSINDLSKASGIIEKVVSKCINLHSGKNFNQYINTYRVEEAKNLLGKEEYQNMSMEGIGESAGFNSRATFYATFKKATGVSPNEFRKKLMN